jgi:hypothetical protein
MPKSGSKKCGGKRVAAKSDFAKVRHKVGRKVPQATNVTNTAVHAKRIVLPGAHARGGCACLHCAACPAHQAARAGSMLT